MATTRHAIDYIVSTPGVRGGRPRIDGQRITVSDVALAYDGAGGSWSAQRIAQEFGLALSKVHAALSYYFDHREEIDREIAEDHASGSKLIDELGIPSVREWVEGRQAKPDDKP